MFYQKRCSHFEHLSDQDIATAIIELRTRINHFSPDDFYDARNADKYIYDLHTDFDELLREGAARSIPLIICSNCESDNMELIMEIYAREGKVNYQCADCAETRIEMKEYPPARSNDIDG